MAKFHFNRESGDAGPCRAESGNCPFGSDDEHYTSKEAASRAYEDYVAGATSGDFWETLPPLTSPVGLLQLLDRLAVPYDDDLSKLKNFLDKVANSGYQSGKAIAMGYSGESFHRLEWAGELLTDMAVPDDELKYPKVYYSALSEVVSMFLQREWDAGYEAGRWDS